MVIELYSTPVTPSAVVAGFMHLAVTQKTEFQLSHPVVTGQLLVLHQRINWIESGQLDVVIDDEEENCVEISHHDP